MYIPPPLLPNSRPLFHSPLISPIPSRDIIHRVFLFFFFFFSLPSPFPCVRSTEVSYCWQWYPFKKGGGRWSRPRDQARGPSARLHLSLRKRLRPRLPFLSNVFPPSGEINSLLGCSAGNLVDRASALRITFRVCICKIFGNFFFFFNNEIKKGESFEQR